jgi:coenzyme F420-reducing hydrogenase delta subunit
MNIGLDFVDTVDLLDNLKISSDNWLIEWISSENQNKISQVIASILQGLNKMNNQNINKAVFSK